MNPFGQKGEDASSATPRGFAIILTLLVLTMMTVLVIGFNAATRTEQLAARNFGYQEVAGQMAMRGVSEAISLLNTQLSGSGVATQPGRAWALLSSPPRPIPLTSGSVAGANQNNRTNINTWRVGANGTSYFVFTNTNSTDFAVPLVDVRLGPGLAGANPNLVVGRFGFWIDDDGSRLNLNYATPYAPNNNRASFLPTNARPLVINTNIFTNLTTFSLVQPGTNSLFGLINPAQTNIPSIGWGYFFTPRQIANVVGINEARYNSTLFQLGAGPANLPDRTFPLVPDGKEPMDLSSAGQSGILSMTEYGGSKDYSNSLANLTKALDGVMSNYFQGTNYARFFGSSNGLTAKYGRDIARQILVNINDASMLSSAPAFTGANTNDMLASTNSTGNNNPIPLAVFGNRPSPFLNEVAVGVAQFTQGGGQPGASPRAEIQVWMQCELVDPYQTGEGSGWEIKYKIRSLKFTGTYQSKGETVTFSNAPNSAPWGGSGFDGDAKSVTNTRQLTPRSYIVPNDAFAFEWQLLGAGSEPPIPEGASNITLRRVEVEPALTVLRKTPGEATSIRDWAVMEDFPAGHFVYTDVPQAPTYLGYNGYGPRPPVEVDFKGKGKGIAKNDPRVRRFMNYTPPSPAWIAVGQGAVTLGAANSSVNFNAGTGISGLQSDKTGGGQQGGGNSIFDHPSFSGTYASKSIIPSWVSPFDLSRIHTGLQWRTLQLRSQDQAESDQNFAPDWALLEVCTASQGGASPPVKVNLNSLAYPAAGSMAPSNAVASGFGRPSSVASLLAGMTANNAPAASVRGNSLGIPAAAGFSEAVGNANSPGYMRVATNVAAFNFSQGWTKRRSQLVNAYPSGIYALASEVLEARGVSDFSADDAANEGRARGIFDAVTTSSEVFTVYTAGFAVDRSGRVAAEARVRAQVARDPNTGRFRLLLAEPLSWPP